MAPVYQQLSNYKKPQGGVATFVQGTVVLGDLGSSGQMSKGQLSKKILVQGDFWPRKLLPVISLLKLFLIFSIGYFVIGLMSLGQSGPWTTVPWTNI